jgi:hypothetical protein
MIGEERTLRKLRPPGPLAYNKSTEGTIVHRRTEDCVGMIKRQGP